MEISFLRTKSDTIDYARHFDNGVDYNSFLLAHGSESDRAKWQRVFEQIQLNARQRALLGGFKREMRAICMAGVWCGDCVSQCPIFAQFESANPLIKVRFVDRDADAELAEHLQICGAPRIPQVLFLSEENLPVARYGDRTLSRYRQLGEQLDGAACSTGIVSRGDPMLNAVIQDWLNEFERAQWILRTSPRLRQRHGD